MSANDWKVLLEQWNSDILDSRHRESLAQEIVSTGWLGYPAATDEQIKRAEARLHAQLPGSYKDFLRVSNGWRMTTPFIDRVWSTEETEWLAVRRRGMIEEARKVIEYVGEPDIPDDEYFVYGDGQPPLVRQEHLESSLEVGFGEDYDFYLLIPGVITSAGEWEACLSSAKSAEARRYRTFWDLMLAEYESFLRLKDVP